MDHRGGCCIARYAGGYELSKVDRILLSFRPIAPKPESFSSRGTTSENSKVSRKTSRPKRKYNRDASSNCSKRFSRRRKASPEDKSTGSTQETAVVTLPLLPTSPVRKDSSTSASPVQDKDPRNFPMFSSFTDGPTRRLNDQMLGVHGIYSRSSDHNKDSLLVVGSCVIVEYVSDTSFDHEALGSTDEERRRNLKVDTCPGFISDGYGRVMWTNESYRKMVGQEGKEEIKVLVVMKERFPATCRSFTCRVRLQYSTCRKERISVALPCDVWKMDGVGFAWRLDIDAALSLGR